jgi:hypothetical protein
MVLSDTAVPRETICSPAAGTSKRRLLNGAALNAALWVAASEEPRSDLPKAIEAFRLMATGLLAKQI